MDRARRASCRERHRRRKELSRDPRPRHSGNAATGPAHPGDGIDGADPHRETRPRRASVVGLERRRQARPPGRRVRNQFRRGFPHGRRGVDDPRLPQRRHRFGPEVHRRVRVGARYRGHHPRSAPVVLHRFHAAVLRPRRRRPSRHDHRPVPPRRRHLVPWQRRGFPARRDAAAGGRPVIQRSADVRKLRRRTRRHRHVPLLGLLVGELRRLRRRRRLRPHRRWQRRAAHQRKRRQRPTAELRHAQAASGRFR